jgi:DNA integrity scanning protein DisA with diadenylate cyclase activity
VIEPDGTIVSAGRYLDVNAGSVDIPGGYGGRHRATAALTTYIPAIGVTVSESGGLVRVFRDGRCLITLRSDVRVKK